MPSLSKSNLPATRPRPVPWLFPPAPPQPPASWGHEFVLANSPLSNFPKAEDSSMAAAVESHLELVGWRGGEGHCHSLNLSDSRTSSSSFFYEHRGTSLAFRLGEHNFL